MASIKGSKLSSKLQFVRSQFGEPAVQLVVDSLPEDQRETFRNLIDLCWYPSDTYEQLVTAICRVAARGDEGAYDRMGAYSAEHQLSNIYSAFKRDDFVKMLKNMVPMHKHLNDPGQMEVHENGLHECTIIVTEPKSTRIGCRISRAFYRRVAEISGAPHVQVSESECTAEGAAACRFRISWS